MLKSLFISNYALIDKIEIDFEKGFSVITGETGAGKSIILGALSLVLGQRSDLSVLKNKEKKSVIEAIFNIKDYGLESFFMEDDVDFEEETTIRREILSSGKSRAFVNDTPVTLNFLKSISAKLIDIHSQHQNLLLGDYRFQLNVVDAVANNSKVRGEYAVLYKEYKALIKKKNQLEDENQRLQNDTDYIRFQYEQLSQLKLQDGEQQLLEAEREELSHSEEIKGGLYNAVQLLNGEVAVLSHLKEVVKNIEKISKFVSTGEEWLQRLNSTYLELEDIHSELEGKEESIEFDPTRLDTVSIRLNEIYSLQQKHKVDSIAELLTIQEKFSLQLDKVASFDEEINELDKTIAKLKDELQKCATVLTVSRKNVFKTIETTITGQLKELGMPNAQFVIDHNVLGEFSEIGIDNINFLFSANKQGQLAEIPKVASGGEMSRVMLCIKALLSVSKGLPTIIFDEIDTGVSGEVADKMGQIMQQMASNIQVLSITHLPQIAVKGMQHYKVFKSDTKDATHTSIEVLSYDDRIKEVAKMLSGSSLTEAALSNAEDLLEQAKIK